MTEQFAKLQLDEETGEMVTKNELEKRISNETDAWGPGVGQSAPDQHFAYR